MHQLQPLATFCSGSSGNCLKILIKSIEHFHYFHFFFFAYKGRHKKCMVYLYILPFYMQNVFQVRWNLWYQHWTYNDCVCGIWDSILQHWIYYRLPNNINISGKLNGITYNFILLSLLICIFPYTLHIIHSFNKVNIYGVIPHGDQRYCY